MGVLFSHKGAFCYKQTFIDYTGLVVLATAKYRVKEMSQPHRLPGQWQLPSFVERFLSLMQAFTKGRGRHTTAQHSYILAEGILPCICDLCPSLLHGFFQLASSTGLTLQGVVAVELNLVRLEAPHREPG